MEGLAGAAAALQASDFGAWARGPAYATLNVLHLLGLVLLVGGIGVVDLRLCGLGRAIPAAALARFLTPYAVAGLAIAAASGTGLFAADAVSLYASTTFRWKLALIMLGLLNAAVFRLVWRGRLEDWDRNRPILALATALASLVIWLAVGTLGRLIAYT